MKKIIIIACIFTIMIPAFIFARGGKELNCLYVSNTGAPGPDTAAPIIAKLTEWGHTIEFVNVKDLADYSAADYEPYDFAFVDEIIGSSDLKVMEGHPIPIVNMENWAAKSGSLGYTNSSMAENLAAEPIVIVNGKHPLAAKFKAGEEVIINTSDAGAVIIPNLPEIDFIGIAKVESRPDLWVVYGIEAGGTTVNGVDIINKCAVIGLHAEGYAGITEDGFKMIKAAIDWVTK